METAESDLSLKQLRTNLKVALKNSGVLNDVKAKLRREFISTLSGERSSRSKLTNQDVSIHERINMSLLYHFLLSKKLEHSLSVFCAETGLDSFGVLSESDLSKLLQLPQAEFDDFRNPESNSENLCCFERILEEFNKKVRLRVVDAASQTAFRGDDGVSPMESLQANLSDLRKSLTARREAEKISPIARSVEERMIIFQRECEERYQQDLQIRVAYLRESEIAKVRLEESFRARKELEAAKQELEAEYQRRLQAQAEREADQSRRAADRERQLQLSQYEARERMQREMDDLRAREKAATRQVELETQGLRMLELRVKEMQTILEGREREVSLREKDVEHKFRDCLEKAREISRSEIQSEMDSVLRERMTLLLEKQTLEDEKAAQASLLEAAVATRKQLREAQAELVTKDDELDVLRLRVDRLQRSLSSLQNDAEKEKVTPLPEQRRLSLEQQLAAMNQRELDHVAETTALQKSLAEVAQQKQELEQLIEDQFNEIIKLRKENAHLEKLLADSKESNGSLNRELQAACTKLSAAKQHREQLEKLLADQKATIETFQLFGFSGRSSSGSAEPESRQLSDTLTSSLVSSFNAKYNAIKKGHILPPSEESRPCWPNPYSPTAPYAMFYSGDNAHSHSPQYFHPAVWPAAPTAAPVQAPVSASNVAVKERIPFPASRECTVGTASEASEERQFRNTEGLAKQIYERPTDEARQNPELSQGKTVKWWQSEEPPKRDGLSRPNIVADGRSQIQKRECEENTLEFGRTRDEPFSEKRIIEEERQQKARLEEVQRRREEETRRRRIEEDEEKEVERRRREQEDDARRREDRAKQEADERSRRAREEEEEENRRNEEIERRRKIEEEGERQRREDRIRRDEEDRRRRDHEEQERRREEEVDRQRRQEEEEEERKRREERERQELEAKRRRDQEEEEDRRKIEADRRRREQEDEQRRRDDLAARRDREAAEEEKRRQQDALVAEEERRRAEMEASKKLTEAEEAEQRQREEDEAKLREARAKVLRRRQEQQQRAETEPIVVPVATSQRPAQSSPRVWDEPEPSEPAPSRSGNGNNNNNNSSSDDTASFEVHSFDANDDEPWF